MRGFLLRRLPSGLLVLLLASFLIFLILRLIPGDPATSLAGPDAGPQAVAAIRARLGLDQPLLGQYLHWLSHLLTGDLGPSYAIGGQVGDLIGAGLGNTVELTLGALLLVIALALPLGVLGATARRRPVALAVRAVTTAVLAVPPFVTGVLLVLLFAVTLRLLPAGGHESILEEPDIGVQYLLLPAVCLALPSAAVLGRYLQDGLQRALAEDYVRTATALGISRRRITWRHALPNALPAAVTVLGLQVGQLLGGAVLVEAIFAWPGLGQLAEQGVLRRDYPVVQDLLLLLVAAYVAVQLLTDLVYSRLDPRISWREDPMSATTTTTATTDATTDPADPDAPAGRPRRRHPHLAALRTPRGLSGLLLLGAVLLAGLLAPLLSSADPTAQSASALADPSAAHPLGTDDLGRDLLSRVLHGIGTDLLISLTAVPVGALLGCSLALLAATSRWADLAVQRAFDLVLAFPGLILALAVTAILGPGRWPVVIVIALAEIPGFGRQLRAGILVQQEREYAVAARVGGASRLRVLLRHVLPNAVDPLIVQGALALSLAVFIEGAMSFLGVGVRPPEPSLGSILSESMGYLATHPFFAAAPLAAVTALVLGFTLIAEALNEGLRR